jgi:hypothetical protein
MDISTDVNDVAQRAVFMWGFGSKFVITEELLESIPMHGNTTGEDIFSDVERQLQ